MKILIDMNLSPTWVPFLVNHGIEAIHVFTHDLDFGTLLAARKTRGPSVIQIRTQDVLPSAIGDIVLRAIGAGHDHLEAGAIVTVDPARNRIRLLPI
jgi:predicted nuclease of predicted toxin-antitoxin system